MQFPIHGQLPLRLDSRSGERVNSLRYFLDTLHTLALLLDPLRHLGADLYSMSDTLVPTATELGWRQNE